jgi:hypothetical protein
VLQAVEARGYRAAFNSPGPFDPQLRMRDLRRCKNQNPIAEAEHSRRLKSAQQATNGAVPTPTGKIIDKRVYSATFASAS